MQRAKIYLIDSNVEAKIKTQLNDLEYLPNDCVCLLNIELFQWNEAENEQFQLVGSLIVQFEM